MTRDMVTVQLARQQQINDLAAGFLNGVVVHKGARTKTAMFATLDVAEAKGKGTIVYFPPGANYDVGTGFSLSGYSCQIRGGGAAMLDNTTPAGTVFYASSQTGPVLDFKGWVAPVQFSGKVRHGDFAIRGSGSADATKANIGMRVDYCQSTVFSDIAIMGTGGPGLKITADVPGYACYLCDFERITIRTPVSAKANDVPYFHAIEANGNIFYRLGFISRVASADTGVSGAVIVEGTASYPSHDNMFFAPWFENLHVPDGGCLIWSKANSNIWDSAQLFDCEQEVGAANTCVYRMDTALPASYGANEIRGFIPGDNNGTGDVIPVGVELIQNGNSVDGIKGYRGGNVLLKSGTNYNYVNLKGSQANASTLGWVDNSGTTTNHLIDSIAKREVVPTGTQTAGLAPYTDLGNIGTSNMSINLSLYTSGITNCIKWTCTGNPTFTGISNGNQGQQLTFMVTQDGTGSRTMTWDAVFKWAGATAPTLTTTAGRTDIFTFVYNGTSWFEVSRSMNVG